MNVLVCIQGVHELLRGFSNAKWKTLRLHCFAGIALRSKKKKIDSRKKTRPIVIRSGRNRVPGDSQRRRKRLASVM